MSGLALQDILTFLLEPRLSVILLSLFVAISVPLLHHVLLYHWRAAPEIPAFLVMGTSGSGKTCVVARVSPTPKPSSRVLTMN